jgi:hypothetical protein
MHYEDQIFASVYGNDCGDRLTCLSFEAPYLSAEIFAATVWQELSLKLSGDLDRVYPMFMQPQLIEKLYDYYIDTRPELDAGFVMVSDGNIIGAYPKEPSTLEPWGGFTLSPDGHVPKTQTFPCTGRVLMEFIQEHPSTDDFAIRVNDRDQVRYYHADELRPTHSYQ